jgi:hypothetical protein
VFATYGQRLDDKRTKLDAKNTKCVFVRYKLDSKAYILIEKSNGKFIISKDVGFNEVVKKGSKVGKTTWTLEVGMKLVNLEHKDEKDAGVEKF